MFFTLFIFVLAYVVIASEKFPRHWVALLGGGLLILFGILSPYEAFSYINWETLGLLAGMFFLVSILQEAGFFSWLAMKSLKNPPRLWINAGSATIYRHAEDRCQDEYGGELGTGFSIEVCKAWEESVWKWKTPGTRKIALRIGMVLGRKDSVFPYLRRLVYSGLGGYQGMGNQYISWIHQQDFARVTEWLLQQEELEGVFNCTAPASVSNRFFMKQMRQTYGIPVGVPMPKWLLEIGAVIMRTETELVLKSRWVYPRRLLESGFKFSFPNAEMAIHELASQRV